MGRKRTITPERLLDEALALIEDGGLAALTMRALAARAGIDPMAAYHYFPDKDALLRAAAARAYRRLSPRPPKRAGWQRRVAALAHAYVAMLARHRELLRYVTTHAEPAASIFDAHFAAAIAPLRLAPHAYGIAQHALVDFLHGFALAGPIDRRALDAELRVITMGISSLPRFLTPRHRLDHGPSAIASSGKEKISNATARSPVIAPNAGARADAGARELDRARARHSPAARNRKSQPPMRSRPTPIRQSAAFAPPFR